LATANERRAANAKLALTTYVAQTYGRPLDDLSFNEKFTAIADFIGDLHHYADTVTKGREVLDVSAAISSGAAYYPDELHGERVCGSCDGRCCQVGLSE
jgi:hypothetical protein